MNSCTARCDQTARLPDSPKMARERRHIRVTESALFHSRLRATPIKFFAKVDYRKTIGPDHAR